MTTEVTVNSVQELVEYLDSGVDPHTWFYITTRERFANKARVASAHVKAGGKLEFYVFPSKFKAALTKRIMADYTVIKSEDDYCHNWGWGRVLTIDTYV